MNYRKSMKPRETRRVRKVDWGAVGARVINFLGFWILCTGYAYSAIWAWSTEVAVGGGFLPFIALLVRAGTLLSGAVFALALGHMTFSWVKPRMARPILKEETHDHE